MTDDERAEQIRARLDTHDFAAGGYTIAPTDLAWLLAERDALLAKVARVEAVVDEWYDTADDGGYVQVKIVEGALNPNPTLADRCTQQSPLAALSEPQCTKSLGHERAHVFTSHEGRTPLEVMPK